MTDAFRKKQIAVLIDPTQFNECQFSISYL